MLTSKDYQDAIDVQNAVNGTGIARSLHEIMSKLLDDTHSTQHTNSHPIVRLYLAKLADLAGMEYSWPSDDYEYCVKMAKWE